jgi:hypothetical protein
LVDQLTSLKHQAMLRQNFIKNAALIVSCTLLTGLTTLSAQTMASFGNVQQAQMDLSTTVRSLEQNILLALTAGVALLAIVLVYYVFKESAKSNRPKQANRSNYLLTLLLLVVGMGMFCSSCGVAQEMQATPSDLTQAHMQSGCPHHQANGEPAAFAYVYRTTGYPAQRTSICKFCGQRIVNTRD